jgi:hypothetical protein
MVLPETLRSWTHTLAPLMMDFWSKANFRGWRFSLA